MSRMKLLTKNGHNLFDVASCLQKSIRRSDYVYAGYCVNELRGRYNEYLWKKLLIVSAEDCWGVITHEIIALKEADKLFNVKYKGYDRNGEFLSKAVTLLLKVAKNRDSDWFACNLIASEDVLDLTEYIKLPDTDEPLELPDYTFDCHTLKGKINGKTKADMIHDEQQALTPHKQGDFDDENWDNFHIAIGKIKQKDFNNEKGFPMPTKDAIKSIDEQEKLF